MAMRRVTLVIPSSLDERILELKKEDRFVRSSYAAVARQLLEIGLLTMDSQEPQTNQSAGKETADAATLPGTSDKERNEERITLCQPQIYRT